MRNHLSNRVDNLSLRTSLGQKNSVKSASNAAETPLDVEMIVTLIRWGQK
jgi:hypothetical protein